MLIVHWHKKWEQVTQSKKDTKDLQYDHGNRNNVGILAYEFDIPTINLHSKKQV